MVQDRSTVIYWNYSKSVGQLVADKRQIKKSINTIKRVKTWQLVVILLLGVFITATFLRLNNIEMSNRREAVVRADTQGDYETVQDRLYDLQRYSSQHMNANTGVFYLEDSYKRASKKAYDHAAASASKYGNIYKKAQEVCKPKFTAWSMAYVNCTRDELAKYPASSPMLDSVDGPSPSLYRHNFSSPAWSPDFAGYSLLACLAVALVIIARLVTLGILRFLLKRHYRGV